MVDIFIEHDLVDTAVNWRREYYDTKNIAIVCDDNTLPYAESYFKALEPHGAHIIRLGKRVYANHTTADALIVQSVKDGLILGVGSGTINDLCKYAAYSQNKDYAIVATAPSMNGYLSPTASLKIGKHKHSIPCQQPSAVFADLDILCKAPAKMIRAGLSDSLCRSTVQADMILAHHLIGAEYSVDWFKEMVNIECQLLEDITRLANKDTDAIIQLTKLLLVAGETMNTLGSSAPASQAEHMIAHMMETLYGDISYSLHGEQIAVTTATMAGLQEKLLHKCPTIKANAISADRFRTIFGKELGATLFELYQKKIITPERAEELNDTLPNNWEKISEQIRGVIISSSSLELIVKKMNGTTDYTKIGWSKDRYEHGLSHAYMSRDRFTFLDIMAMNKNLRVWF